MSGNLACNAWYLITVLLGLTTGVAVGETLSQPLASDSSSTSPVPPPLSSTPAAEADTLSPGKLGEVDPADSLTEIVRQRVLSRWGAMIDRDFHRAYGFCSPAFRGLYTAGQYAARYGNPQLAWKQAEVLSVRKEGDDAVKVEIRLLAQAFVPDAELTVPVSTVFTEDWIRADGEWWYSPQK